MQGENALGKANLHGKGVQEFQKMATHLVATRPRRILCLSLEGLFPFGIASSAKGLLSSLIVFITFMFSVFPLFLSGSGAYWMLHSELFSIFGVWHGHIDDIFQRQYKYWLTCLISISQA